MRDTAQDFVAGIGPPLSQIEQDYREWAEQEPYNDRIVKDVLALIAEVRRLRQEQVRRRNGEDPQTPEGKA